MSFWYEGPKENGVPHGLGKYIHRTGYTIYEGSFKNGKRHGKGRTFLPDGTLSYDGFWKDGVRNGFGKQVKQEKGAAVQYVTAVWAAGVIVAKAQVYDDRVFVWNNPTHLKKCKEYSPEGELLFEGEVSAMKLYEGTGKRYENGKLVYSGRFKKGKPEGSGMEYWNAKIIYEGAFVDGKRHGQGKEYAKDDDSVIMFEGWWKAGLKHGYGITNKNKSGVWLKGEFSDAGQLHKGRVYCESKVYTMMGKLLYEGGLKDRVYHGSGKEYDASNNLVYEGDFEDGVRQGEGKLFEKGRLVFEGGLEGGEKTGNGKEYITVWNSKLRKAIPRLVFDGWFLNGKRNGSGTEYRKDAKKIYEGNFVNGLRHGDGVEFLSSGKPCFKGQFSKGKRLGVAEFNKNGKRARS